MIAVLLANADTSVEHDEVPRAGCELRQADIVRATVAVLEAELRKLPRENADTECLRFS
jgi:hypothetical protein